MIDFHHFCDGLLMAYVASDDEARDVLHEILINKFAEQGLMVQDMGKNPVMDMVIQHNHTDLTNLTRLALLMGVPRPDPKLIKLREGVLIEQARKAAAAVKSQIIRPN